MNKENDKSHIHIYIYLYIYIYIYIYVPYTILAQCGDDLIRGVKRVVWEPPNRGGKGFDQNLM